MWEKCSYSKIYSTGRSLYLPLPQCKVGAVLFLFFLFCSSFRALKNLSELAKGCGTWERGGEDERRWVEYFPDDSWHHNPKLHPQPSRVQFLVKLLPQSLLGGKLPFLNIFSLSVQVFPCSLLHRCLSICDPLYISASHTITFPFRLNGSKPNKIMPQEPHEATDLQLILRQIFLDLKTSKFYHYLAKWLWADSTF